MPRPRFARAPADKREALLDAAAQEFASHGYEDASINAILLAAGFSKGAFYYYFDDKPDLAAAVLEREAGRYLHIWAELRKPKHAEDFWREIIEVLERGTAELKAAPAARVDAMLRIGTAMSRDPELAKRMMTPAFREATTKLATYWKQGQEVGAVRVDLPVTTLLAILQDIKLVLVRALLPHDRTPTPDELVAFGKLHLDLIRRIAEVRHEHA
jgi:AcrR family transcriptional regulator